MAYNTLHFDISAEFGPEELQIHPTGFTVSVDGTEYSSTSDITSDKLLDEGQDQLDTMSDDDDGSVEFFAVEAPEIPAGLASYMRTKTPLSTTDAALVDSRTEEAAKSIEEISDDIKQAKSEILELCRRIAKLSCTSVQKQMEIQILDSLRAPARCLPAEILNVIFEMCLPEGGGKDDWKTTAQFMPFILCQICKVWRDTAIRNSALWKTHGIEIPQSPTYSWVYGCERLLDMFIERCRSRPLSLEIRSTPDRLNKDGILLKETCEVIHRAFPFVTELKFAILSLGLYKNLFRRKTDENTFEKLKTLSLIIDLGDTEIWKQHTSDKVCNYFATAPNLVKLSFISPHPTAALWIALPHPQIQSLNYETGSPYWIRDRRTAIETWQTALSKDYINVTSVETAFRGAFYIFPAPNRINKLSDITSLKVLNEWTGDAAFLFAGLSLPKLSALHFEALNFCSLVVNPGDLPSDEAEVSYLTFANIRPMFLQLTSLSLLRVSIQDEDLLSVLESIPNVQNLRLLLIGVVDCATCSDGRKCLANANAVLLQLLTSSAVNTSAADVQNHNYLLPFLDVLHLYYPRPCQQTLGAGLDLYAAMVQARAEVNRRAGLSPDEHRGKKSFFKLSLSFEKGAFTTSSAATRVDLVLAAASANCPATVEAVVESFGSPRQWWQDKK